MMSPFSDFNVRHRPLPRQKISHVNGYAEVRQREGNDSEPYKSTSAGALPPMATGWRPFWTRRYVLFTFAACFATILAALEVIDWYSDHHQGIATAQMNQYYLWTYGPTAILTLVLALWNRVDYRVRQMTPWVVLSQPSMRSRTNPMFLDYITLSQPEILWQSLRNRHWSVLSSGVISSLQTIAVIFSTGLFILGPAHKVTNNVDYTTSSRFVNNENISFSLSRNSLPMNVYDAIKSLGLSRPIGTTDKFAYQTFSPTDSTLSSTAVQQATVDVFTVGLDCVPAEMHVVEWAFSWAFAPCYTAGDVAPTPSANGSIYITQGNCNITAQPYYSYGSDGDIGNFAVFTYDLCVDNGDYDDASNNRLVFGFGQAKQIGDVGPLPTTEGCNDTAPLANIEVIKAQYWICTSQLEVNKANVTLNSSMLTAGAEPEIQLNSTDSPSTLSNISLWYFNGGIMGLPVIDNYQEPLDIPVTLSALSDSVFAEMMTGEVRVLQRAPNATLDELLTTDLYFNLSKDFFTELSVLAVNSLFTTPDGNRTTGTITTIEQRLFTRGPPLRALQSMLGGIVIFILGLMLLPLQANIPHDMASLNGLVDVLVDNREFSDMLRGHGALSVAELHYLASNYYRSRLVDCQSMHAHENQQSLLFFASKERDPVLSSSPPLDANLVDHSQSIKCWWRPATIRIPARTVMFWVVIGLVVVLQVLRSLSKERRGLFDVSNSGNQHLAWSLIPAAVMATVAMYFKALNGVYRIFAPFCKLRKSGPSQSTIAANYVSATEIEILIMLLRDRQPGPFFTTLAALMSAFLTIIVSGVFTATITPAHIPSTTRPVTWFNTSGSSDNGIAGNNALISGLILEANLSYPTMTYENLAFASMHEPDTQTNIHADGSYDFQIVGPAIRSSLNCTMYGQKDIPDLTYYPGVGGSHSYYGIYANLPGPPDCASNKSLLVSNSVPNGGNPPFEFSSAVNSSTDGCPDIYYFWGQQTSKASNYSNSSVDYAAAMACYEAIEQVDVNTTYSMPGFTISSDNPPMVRESSKKTISTTRLPLPYDKMPEQDYGSDGSLNPNFFGALRYLLGVPEAALSDPARVSEIAEAIKTQHGIVRAQQYNAALRYSISNASTTQILGYTNNTIDGLMIVPQRYRLVVNEVSTDVLSGLLVAMVLCGLLASWLMSTKKVLPKNPCSIIAMASLLADSNILHEPRRGQFYGHRFQMGWFRSRGNNKAVFTINHVSNVDSDPSNDYGFSGSERELMPLPHHGSRTRSSIRAESGSTSPISLGG